MSKKINLADATRAREAFLSGAEEKAGRREIQEDSSTDVQTDIHTYRQLRSASPRARVSTPAPPQRKHFTFSLDIALHQRLRIAAAVEGRQMRDLIEESLAEYLDRTETPAT